MLILSEHSTVFNILRSYLIVTYKQKESAMRANNPQGRTRAGKWLEEEGLTENKSNAVLWPEQASIADSIVEETEIDRLIASGPHASEIFFTDVSDTLVTQHTSHELAKEVPSEVDLEYGWALAKDTINSIEQGLSREEAMEKIAGTSDTLLSPGGYAVYNLESVGSRYEMPRDEALTATENTLQYANDLQDIIHREYSKETELYEDPDFDTNSPHLVWQKPEE